MGWSSYIFIILNIFSIPVFADIPDGTSNVEPEQTSQIKKDNSSVSTSSSRSMGHLLTSNNNILSKGEVGVGTLYVGVGISDHLMISSSPFIQEFDMYNAQLRGAWKLSKDEVFGLEYDYFKTHSDSDIIDESYDWCSAQANPYWCEFGFDNFKMEAWATKITYSKKWNSFYRTSITTAFFYYIDDSRPFSFRMDPQNDDKYALTLSSLHEFHLHDRFYVNLEAGIWGLNYAFPYIHSGMTLNFQTKRFLAGMGASATFSPHFPKERARQFMGYDSRKSVHPEIQIQAFF